VKGYLDAADGQDKDSAGKIAVQRAGFRPNHGRVGSNRDDQVREMEEELIKQLAAKNSTKKR